MKPNLAAIVAAASLLVTAITVAQNAPTPCPAGQRAVCANPALTSQERAARQAACLEKNGGVCPKGGAQATCPKTGQGPGKGAMKGKGNGRCAGLRDGTGPRSQNGTCTQAQPQAARQ